MMDNTAKRFSQTCPECCGQNFVENYAAGDLICRDKAGADPNRVGGPTNKLFEGGGLSTVIGKTQGDGGASYALGRLNARTNQQDRVLMNAFGEISGMCHKLGLVEKIKDRACELYKEYKDLKSIRGRKAIAFYAACIYIACRLENLPRTFKEINAAAPDASKRDIARCFRAVLNEMQGVGVRVNVGTIHASNYMRRFGSHLNFTNDDMIVCEQIANAACPKDGRENGKEKRWDGRSPISIAAAIIYLITQTPREGAPTKVVDLRSIVEVTGVSEGTITTTYKQLLEDKDTLIPEWYTKPTKGRKKRGREASSPGSAQGQQNGQTTKRAAA